MVVVGVVVVVVEEEVVVEVVVDLKFCVVIDDECLFIVI